MTVLKKLSSLFEGKSVAIIGNAPVDLPVEEIEGHDVVIQMNKGPLHRDIRLDVYCYSGLQWDVGTLETIHMTPKDRWKVEGVRFYPLEWWEELYNALQARPTTGCMVVDMVRRSRPESVKLYAFNWFATPSLEGEECAIVHAPDKEKVLIGGWLNDSG